MIAARHIFVALACLLLACCNEIVEDRYDTRNDAETDRLFERGWLPKVIPQSSYDLLIQNDLDLNTSEGEFRFDPQDIDEFFRALRECRKSDIDPDTLLSEAKLGYRPFCYSSEDSRWIFWINRERGHCRYSFQTK